MTGADRRRGPGADAPADLHFHNVARGELRAATRRSPVRHISIELRTEIATLLDHLDLSPGMRLLDFGCADLPYRALVPHGVEHVGADLVGNPDATVVVRPGGTLDLPDGGFDAVLSTQVLEHVADPAVYLRECHRVLRPGGRLALTTHGMMVYHPDPDDYWRWTSAGLRRILEAAGFEVLRFEGVMGTAATGLQLVQEAVRGRVPRRLRPAFVGASQRLIGAVDRRQSRESKARDALVFSTIAARPPTTTAVA